MHTLIWLCGGTPASFYIAYKMFLINEDLVGLSFVVMGLWCLAGSIMAFMEHDWNILKGRDEE